jgi:hypothetical protein
MKSKEETLKEARDELRLMLDDLDIAEMKYQAEVALEALDTVIDGAFVGTKRVKIVDLVRFATSVEALLAKRDTGDLVFSLVDLVYGEDEGLGLEPTAGPPDSDEEEDA